jgi:hypothetical protein
MRCRFMPLLVRILNDKFEMRTVRKNFLIIAEKPTSKRPHIDLSFTSGQSLERRGIGDRQIALVAVTDFLQIYRG